ncbi:flagellar hook-basal body complex protein FliE [Aquabacter sp. L1I39]|uniref:flagellar hook-basal body complex protein FliE n=1 Tax=Aquabacter sp. L1I39 TaxID=2820278 RepID=UPI001AD98743|nr:flagellar hook-basal body complex protein FliE [Aquabacter sp. L1I39]QTL04322.1 flagellar hook-basal body complex protein FliE [Aquabacter sp. L1I39]
MIDGISFNSLSRTGTLSQVRTETQTGGIDAAAAAASAADFSTVLARMSSDAVDSVRAGEATAISGIGGKASVQQVVEAIMNAEQTLQTAIAVRDKVVAAYQEISRMAI